MAQRDQNSTQKVKRVSPQGLRDLLANGKELAVIDVRESGIHSRDGHPLLVTTLPLSRLELEIAAAIPRRNTSLVLFDEGSDTLAQRAADRLHELGYSDIAILSGGTRAWKEAGFELFTGTHVVGIAFGEFAEHVYGTPHVSSRELKARLDRGDNVVVLDSRTIPEFKNFSIPGAVDLPGAEIVYRFHEAVPDPEALVVVNCAGRTRSIIGAQALINAGVPNKVVSLANGTMDWLMEGYKLDNGAYNFPPPPTGEALTKAEQSAERLRRHFEVKIIGRADLARFQRAHEIEERTLYLLDVRTEEEYQDGHLPGSRWAQGGQLVQQVDRWAGTRNSRIVLIDSDDLVRSSITASWLNQINWAEVYILEDALSGALEVGPEPLRIAARLPEIEKITPQELRALPAGSVTIVDVDTSAIYRQGHIPGAHFAIRERLGGDAGKVPGSGTIIVTSADGRLAAFAAGDLRSQLRRPVKVLAGGTQSWINAGYELESGETSLLHPAEDFLVHAYQQPEDERFPAFRRYLGWELGLVEQLERDGASNYRIFPPVSAPRQSAE